VSGDEPELEGPKGFRSGFYVYRSANQGPYAQGVIAPIEWDVEVFDNLDEMLIIAPWQFRARRAGFYFLHAAAQWQTVALDFFHIYFRLNGAGNLAECWSGSPSILEPTTQVSAIIHLDAGDTIDVLTDWTSTAPAGNRLLYGTQPHTYFMGHRLS
jgi:hypothetical protein